MCCLAIFDLISKNGKILDTRAVSKQKFRRLSYLHDYVIHVSVKKTGGKMKAIFNPIVYKLK